MEFFIIAALIILNGLLAMSEIALVSVRKSNLAEDIKNGSKSAKQAIELAENPDKFFSTVQIGITLIGILTGIYSGDALASSFVQTFEKFGFPQHWSLFAAQGTIVIVATYLTLIFGELVPKRIGLAAPEKVAKIIAAPMTLLSKIASPFVWALSKSSSVVLKIMGIKNIKSKVTEREIKSLVQEGEANGEVQKVERDIVERVFTLGDRFVESIMTPRNDIAKIDVSMSAAQIVETVKKFPHTVYPLTNGSLDEIIGIVSIEELFGKIDEPNFSLKDASKPAFFFKEDTQVYNALEQMRNMRLKNAVISNEFGVTLGFVTLNDIVDAVLGDMPEANEEADIVQRSDGTFLVDGQCPFHDFLLFFAIDDTKEICNTIGGLILSRLKRIPKAGEKVRWGEFDLEVVDMDGARIDKIIVSRLPHDFEA